MTILTGRPTCCWSCSSVSRSCAGRSRGLRRLLGRAARRHREPRDARRHLAPADLAGYWIGRYGETTGRDRTHAPFVSVAVVTLLYASARSRSASCSASPRLRAPSSGHALPGIALNLILTWPVYTLTRSCSRRSTRRERIERSRHWLAQAARAGRFLPPDPRVEEPYRLTPQDGPARRDPRRVALVSSPSSCSALVAADPLGREVLRAAQNNQLRTVTIEAAAWADPRPEGPGPRDERRRHRRRVLPADLPKQGRDTRCAGSRKCSTCRCAGHRAGSSSGGDPLTPMTIQVAVHGRRSRTSRSTRRSSRACRSRQTYLRKYNAEALLAHILGYAGEISPGQLKDCARRPTSAAAAGQVHGGRPHRRNRCGVPVRHVPAGKPRGQGVSGRLARRETNPGRAPRRSPARQRDPADGRHLAPARGRAGTPLRHPPRARRTATGSRTAVRSSPWTRTTARSWPWRPSRPTSRASSSAARAPRSSRRSSTRRSPRRPTTRPQPRDRRRLSAGLDLQAGDGAGRDGGAPGLAVPDLPCTPTVRAYTAQVFKNWDPYATSR